MPLTVNTTTAPADIARCQVIRRTVFTLGQGVPVSIEVDGRDPSCTHFLAVLDGADLFIIRAWRRGEDLECDLAVEGNLPGEVDRRLSTPSDSTLDLVAVGDQGVGLHRVQYMIPNSRGPVVLCGALSSCP